jgi:hypothetical protein
VDPYDVLGMWTAAPRQLDDVELVRARVAGTGCRVVRMGHHHRWDLLVDGVRRPGDGTSELVLPADRSALVVVAAVRDRRGWSRTPTAARPSRWPLAEAMSPIERGGVAPRGSGGAAGRRAGGPGGGGAADRWAAVPRGQSAASTTSFWDGRSTGAIRSRQ